MALNKLLAELAEKDRPLTAGRLTYLSALSKEEAQLLYRIWAACELSRRRQLVEKLVQMAEDNAGLDFNAVFRRCLQDEDSRIRVLGIEGLWECEARWLLASLERLLAADPSEEVRAAAAVALGRFTLLAELGKLRPEEARRVEEVLFARMEDPGEAAQVRRRVMEALGHFSLARVEVAIKEAYASADPQMRVSPLFAMGQNANFRWLPILVRELENEAAEIRCEAAHACGEMADSRAAPNLIPLMDDPDPEVQLAAVDALGKVGGSLARRALRHRLYDPDERLRQAVELALEELEANLDPLHFEAGR